MPLTPGQQRAVEQALKPGQSFRCKKCKTIGAYNAGSVREWCQCGRLGKPPERTFWTYLLSTPEVVPLDTGPLSLLSGPPTKRDKEFAEYLDKRDRMLAEAGPPFPAPLEDAHGEAD